MVEMSCEEHDKYAASSQFITHTVGRVLGQLTLESTPINTKGYETLLSLVRQQDPSRADTPLGFLEHFRI
jgi:arogenate dehydrogenase (NADP+)